MNRAYLTNPDRWNPDIEATCDRVNERHCTGVNPVEFDPRIPPEDFPARAIIWGAAICLAFAALLIGAVLS